MTQAINIPRLNGPTIIGVFDEVSAAEQAINDLKVAGFTPDSISIITRDPGASTTTDIVTETEGNEAGKGAVAGAMGGGTLGAVLGWLLAGGAAVLIPGVGPIIAAGVLGATVTGALVGGSVGSIAAALAGSGIPEEHAQEYEEHVKGGRTIVSVIVPNGMMLQSARDIFERHGAVHVRDYNDKGDDGDYPTPTATVEADSAYENEPIMAAPTPQVATPMPGGTEYIPGMTTATTTQTTTSRTDYVTDIGGTGMASHNTVMGSGETRDGGNYPLDNTSVRR